MRGEDGPTRLYRRLLSLCPEDYRREYGHHMEQVFGDMRRENRHAGRGGLVRLWLRVLPDLASTVISERWKAMGEASSWARRTAANFLGTARKVLTDPGAFYEGIDVEEDLGRPVSFAVACMCLSTALEAIVSYATLRFEDRSLLGALAAQDTVVAKAGLVVLIALFGVFSALITLYLLSAAVHLLVVLFARSTSGFEGTLRVGSYASAAALLGWIPFLGWLATLYGIYVLVVGLRVVHGNRGASIAATAPSTEHGPG